MSTYIRDEETLDFRVVIWTGDEDSAVPNPNGIGYPHETRVIFGAAEFVYDDDPRNPIRVVAGESIYLDVHRGYTVRGVRGGGATEVRCYYPKATPAAIDEIRHILREPGAPARRYN